MQHNGWTAPILLRWQWCQVYRRTFTPVTGGTASTVFGSREFVQTKYCLASCCPWAGARTRRWAVSWSGCPPGFRGRCNRCRHMGWNHPSGSVVVQISAGNIPTQAVIWWSCQGNLRCDSWVVTYVAWFSFHRMTRKCIVRQAGAWESEELIEMRQGKSRQGRCRVCKAMIARD